VISFLILESTKRKKHVNSKKKQKQRKHELKMGNHTESQNSLRSNDGSDETGSTPTSPEVAVSFIISMEALIGLVQG
jgi:hypothetical protein